MRPIPFTEQNTYYPARHASCEGDISYNDLHAWQGSDHEGFPLHVTCWELSDQDILDIQKNKKIWLMQWSKNTAPINITTETPFKIQHADEETNPNVY